MAQRPDCSPSYDSLVGSCNTLLSITIYKYLLLNPRKSSVSTERSPIVLYYNNQGLCLLTSYSLFYLLKIVPSILFG